MMATVGAIAISASVTGIGAAHTTVHVARPTSAASADIIVIARRILGEGTDMGAAVRAIRATITRLATTKHNPLGLEGNEKADEAARSAGERAS
ncbi:hypothetical protein FS749_004988, partial [Ceratobasidium sp. UAMH 11750]